MNRSRHNHTHTMAKLPFAAIFGWNMMAAALGWATFSTPASAQVQTGAVWDGDAGDGLWWTGLNWNNDTVPNNNASFTYWVVTVGSGGAITITSPTTIDKLGIAENNPVHLANGVSLTFIGQTDNQGVTGTLSCQGDFFMDSAGGFTDLRITGGDLVTGNSRNPAFWRLSDHINNRVYGLAATDRLVTDVNHQIRGAGQIGLNQMRLSNYGILINEHVNPLIVDLVGSDNFNIGSILAGHGGRIVLQGTELQNQDGSIEAHFENAYVDLSGAVIHGGLFLSGNTGAIRITGNDTILDNVQNGAVMVALNDVDPILMGTLNNTGEFRLDSGGGFTDLRLNSDVNLVNLGGTGLLSMSPQINNRIYGINGLRRLVHEVNHTIRGSGQIGVNTNFNLTNNGTINAHTGDLIIVDLSAGQNFNNSYFTASDGGVVRIQDTVLDNSTGILYASDTDSRIELSGAHIVNGQLLTDFGGEVRVIGNDTFLENVHSNAHVVVPNDVDPILVGSYTNKVQFDMNSGGGFTDLRLNSDVIINGLGSFNLSDHVNNRMYGINGLRRLDNSAGHTIRGSGQIGVNSNFNLTNNGLIQADQASPLIFDLSAGANFNNNLIQAVNGGVVVFQGTELDNTLGTIVADNASRVDLASSRLIGGEFQSNGTGFLNFAGNDSVLQDITLNGHTVAANDLDPILEGVVLNNGLFEISSTGGHTDLRINSPEATLGGSGELVFTNHLNNRVYGINGLRRFINGVGHTIRGSVQLGVNSNLDVTNRGSIIADASAGTVVDVSNDFTNEGLVHLTGVGSLTFNAGALINGPGGAMLIDAGKTLNASSGMTMTGGHLKGNGTFQGSVANNGGAAAPGQSVGHLVINGAYAQGSGGAFELEIAGYIPFSQYDVLSVQNAVTLAGTLEVSFIDGFEPLPGTSFVFLDGGSIAGQFDQVTGPGIFDVEYRLHTVTLIYVGPAPLCAYADVDCDGFVNVNDLLAVIAGWGQCPAPPDGCAADIAPQGPPEGDGFVNIDDLLAVINNWG